MLSCQKHIGWRADALLPAVLAKSPSQLSFLSALLVHRTFGSRSNSSPSRKKSYRSRIFFLVEHIGFEPMTSSMPWMRATNCANAPNYEVIRLELVERHFCFSFDFVKRHFFFCASCHLCP